MATGDEQTRNEPRLISTYDVPFSRRAVEGKGTILKKKREILRDLQTKLKTLERTDRSPIFLSVKRGIEHLRSRGCISDSACQLLVRTDAEELSERAIRDSIAGGGRRKDLPSVVSNEGIRVTFCGLAEVNALRNLERSKSTHARSAGHGDRLREVWSSLFSAPDLVTFEPYCPTAPLAEEDR